MLLTLIAYVPSLSNEFVTYDDNLLIYRNPNVLEFSPQTLRAVFTTFDPELYVPVTLLSYQVEWAMFGHNSAIFHLTNLLLHVGSILLVFLITRRLSRPHVPGAAVPWVAVLCAALFALHPLNTEGIAWAAARKDILSSFFALLSLALYMRVSISTSDAGNRKSEIGNSTRSFIPNSEFRIPNRNFTGSILNANKSYTWSLLFFLLALLSKVSVVMLPVILVLVDLLEGRHWNKRMITEKAPFFLLSLVFGLIAIFGKEQQLSSLTGLDHLLLGMKGTAWYLGKFVWPVELSLLHPQEFPVPYATPGMIAGVLVVLVLVIVAVRMRKRKPVVSFGIAFYILMLLPTYATFWKNGFVYYASERYAYAPMVGAAFALACVVVPWCMSSTMRRRVSASLGVLLLLVLSALSFRQAQTWKDSETLLRRTLRFNPTSAHAMNNLASSIYEDGDLEEAVELYERALEIDPMLPQVYGNLGIILAQLGEFEKAEAVLRRGMGAIPTHRILLEADVMPYMLLADLFDERGRTEEVVELLKAAVERGPQFASTHLNLGIKQQQYGQTSEALESFRRACDLDERLTDAFYRRAAVAAELGHFDEAIEALERVVWLDPDYEKAQEHLENLRRIRERLGP